MHHIVAGLQIDQVGGESSQRGLAGWRARHQFGSVEQVFAAEYGEAGIAEDHAAPNRAADQVNGGDRSGHVGAPRQVFGRGAGLIQAKLIGDSVLVEDIGDTLDRAGGFGEKRHPRAGFGQVSRLRDSYRHIAVKGQRRARRNVEAGRRAPAAGRRLRDHLKFFESDLRGVGGLVFQILPPEKDAGGIVGRRCRDLFQPRPQTLGGARHLRGFIPQHQRPVEQ